MEATLLEWQPEVGANHLHGERKLLHRWPGRWHFAVYYLRDIRAKPAARSGKWRKPHPKTQHAYPNDTKRGLPKPERRKAIGKGHENPAWQRSRRSSQRLLMAATGRRAAVYHLIHGWKDVRDIERTMQCVKKSFRKGTRLSVQVSASI